MPASPLQPPKWKIAATHEFISLSSTYEAAALSYTAALWLQPLAQRSVLICFLATMAPVPEKEFTEAEVAEHNKDDDCWLIIGNENTGKLPHTTFK